MESGPNALGNNTRPPFIGLGHELGHAETARLGMSDFSLYNGSAIDYELRKVTNDEYNAVKYENLLRKENSIPIRVAYTKDSEDNLFMPFD